MKKIFRILFLGLLLGFGFLIGGPLDPYTAILGCNGSPQSARAYSLAAAPWGLGEAGNFPVHPGHKVPWAPLGPGGFIGG